jgi:dehydrogenase/reductase SDR family protein 12
VLKLIGVFSTEKLVTTEAEYAAGAAYDGTTLYARTKRMQMALTHYYARTEPALAFYSMHPGWSDTPGLASTASSLFHTYSTSLPLP